MKNLPVCVSDHDIEEMFAFADKDRDGQLSYAEFKVFNICYNYFRGNTLVQVMIDPPAPPEPRKPHITDLGLPVQLFSPEPAGPESALASPLLGGSSRPSSFFGSTTSLSTNRTRTNVSHV